MEQNPDIARGFPDMGKTKDTITQFWKDLTIKLNSLGPPIKEWLEWRRVWNGYKRNLKQKIANNYEEIRGTGGGPNIQRSISLTPMEQQVDAILCLSKSGAPSGPSYGVTCRNVNTKEITSEVSTETGNNNCNSNPIPSTSYHSDILTIEDVHNNLLTQASSANKRKSTPANTKKGNIEKKRLELLEEQTKKQKETAEVLKNIEKNTYNLQRYFKKSCELKERELNLLERQLDRQNKNDLQQSNLFLQNLNIKRRKLALEEIKLGFTNSRDSSNSEDCEISLF